MTPSTKIYVALEQCDKGASLDYVDSVDRARAVQLKSPLLLRPLDDPVKSILPQLILLFHLLNATPVPRMCDFPDISPSNPRRPFRARTTAPIPRVASITLTMSLSFSKWHIIIANMLKRPVFSRAHLHEPRRQSQMLFVVLGFVVWVADSSFKFDPQISLPSCRTIIFRSCINLPFGRADALTNEGELLDYLKALCTWI